MLREGGCFHCLFCSVQLAVCRPVDGGGVREWREGAREGEREGVSCI